MKRKNTGIEDKYAKLSELGSDYNLSFSSQLDLGNRIMALDGIKRKLLIAEIKDKVCRSFLIKLDEIRSITLKKIYSSIKPGELAKKGLAAFLKAIYLQFDHEKEKNAIVLPFYESDVDKVEDLNKLEKKATNWYIILSKLANTRNKKPAQLKNGWLSLFEASIKNIFEPDASRFQTETEGYTNEKAKENEFSHT